MRIALIVVAILVVLGTGVIAAGYIWFQTNKEELREMGNAARARGESFGQTATDQDCVETGRDEVLACKGMMCEVEVGIFTSACLEVAQATPGFCDSVPPDSEIMTTVKWRLALCQEFGQSGAQKCGRFLAEVQKHCHA